MVYPLVWIIIGVAGSGKTTIGRLLAERLDCDFIEGDRRHPPTNITKMAAGVALTDQDREPWLADLAAEARNAVTAGRELVISCSALRRSYRDRLLAAGRVQLIHPVVPQDVLLARLVTRSNHYMRREMLESQIRTFEPPQPTEVTWEVDGRLPASALVELIMNRAFSTWAEFAKPWWLR